MAFLYVKAYHGPCTTFNRNMYKPGYLSGLKDRLQKLGFRVDLVPVEFANYCMLEVCGYQVFRCNIRQLRYNTSYSRDVVCQRAVESVMEASVKFRRARAYLWFWTLLDHQIFRRSQYAPADYWTTTSKGKGKHLAEVEGCINCCDIRTKPAKDNKKDNVSKDVTTLETKLMGSIDSKTVDKKWT